ncbi:hypothetical protein [Flintibacter sp. KGMB00164]|uniref:alginate O-acetyltransferase AlgX-related protein n=1 Tax=Flintibacter sp. KGMB00164 TaxID=2610895 RepID=UPI000D7873C2|nr:hypothetical protein [Flintibacter sp. KGMB00164]
MKQKKIANIVLVLAFAGFLTAAMVITLGKPQGGWSYYENRTLAQMEELTPQTLWDGTFADSVEPTLQDHAAGRNTLLKLSTWMDMELFHRPVVNQVIPVEGMLLSWNPYETPDAELIQQQADAMAGQLGELRDVVESYGGKFYYVAVPGQYTYFEETHPDFLNNRATYTDLEIPAFQQAMEEQGVTLIEMGEILAQQGNPPEYYSTVDYHYTFGGAYATYLAILERINQDFDHSLTVLDEDNLVRETLPNPYLGSRARKVFGLWETDEKLEIGLPSQPIPFTRTDNGQEVPATVYTLPGNDTDEVAYAAYMGGDIAETVIDTGRDELPSLLIYGDSFTNPVEGLMYYSFDEMRTIDLRHYKDMTLADYIALYQPDVVVGIRDYESLLSTDYNGSPFEIQP